MGLRHSKRIKRIKSNIQKLINKCYRKLLPFNLHILLSIYPKIIFNNKELEQFYIMCKIFKNNYENIIATNPFFFAKMLKSHFSWISSQDFKTKYNINMISPPHSNLNNINNASIAKYPPLLNPNSFNYNKISANIAYHCNIPLPHYYKFIYLSTYGSGYQAMQKFFRYCGVCVAELWTQNAEPQREYEQFYNTLIENKEKYCIIYLSGINLYGREKLFELINGKVPLLIIARDPISIYKPIINHLGERDYKSECSLRTNYRIFLDSIRYMLDPYNPSINILYDENNYEMQGRVSLSINSRLRALKNVSEVKYISFEQILESQAFDTFNMLAKYYGFPQPKSREIFEAKVNGGMLLGLLPRVLKIHEDDIPFMFQESNTNSTSSENNNKTPQHTIIITTPQIQGSDKSKNLIDMSKELDFEMPFTNINLFIDKISYQKLIDNKKLFEATKIYLKGFLNELKNRANIENNKRLSERDILEKFKIDYNLALKYKALFDKELRHIKKHRPDIVDSWQYYKEFEQLFTKQVKNDY